jgi:hypothetical protein
VRGRGLFAGVELMADPPARRPFPRSARVIEDVFARAFAAGLVTYPSTGCANGIDGDALLIAPPFVVSEAELDELVAILDRVLTERGL